MAMFHSARQWLRAKVAGVVEEEIDTPAFVKYVPFTTSSAYVIPRRADDGPAHRGFPIPPRALYAGYADNPEEWTRRGEEDVATMLRLLAETGYVPQPGQRILDYGCAAGRMIRCLQPLASSCEIWGVDITAAAIYWCQRNLCPPFHFAITTTLPHLPFEDRAFSMIYAGSVFSHIDEMAGAWLLELRRILAPGGRAYLTINDYTTLQTLMERWPNFHVTHQVLDSGCYRVGEKPNFSVLAVNRSRQWWMHTFYELDFFCSRMLEPAFRILSITPEAYSFQTAVVVTRE
jgi:SAM-dependent methyltransferase